MILMKDDLSDLYLAYRNGIYKFHQWSEISESQINISLDSNSGCTEIEESIEEWEMNFLM